MLGKWFLREVAGRYGKTLKCFIGYYTNMFIWFLFVSSCKVFDSLLSKVLSSSIIFFHSFFLLTIFQGVTNSCGCRGSWFFWTFLFIIMYLTFFCMHKLFLCGLIFYRICCCQITFFSFSINYLNNTHLVMYKRMISPLTTTIGYHFYRHFIKNSIITLLRRFHK